MNIADQVSQANKSVGIGGGQILSMSNQAKAYNPKVQITLTPNQIRIIVIPIAIAATK